MKLIITFDTQQLNQKPVTVTITSERVLAALSLRASIRNMYLEQYVTWLLGVVADGDLQRLKAAVVP